MANDGKTAMSLQTFLEQLNNGTLPPPKNELDKALRESFAFNAEKMESLFRQLKEKEEEETIESFAKLLLKHAKKVQVSKA